MIPFGFFVYATLLVASFSGLVYISASPKGLNSLALTARKLFDLEAELKHLLDVEDAAGQPRTSGQLEGVVVQLRGRSWGGSLAGS